MLSSILNVPPIHNINYTTDKTKSQIKIAKNQEKSPLFAQNRPFFTKKAEKKAHAALFCPSCSVLVQKCTFFARRLTKKSITVKITKMAIPSIAKHRQLLPACSVEHAAPGKIGQEIATAPV